MRGMNWYNFPLSLYICLVFVALRYIPVSICPNQLKRVRESEKQCKPLLDKNKLLSKRNDDLTQSIQKLEDKLKSLVKENLEMVGTKSLWHHVFILYFFGQFDGQVDVVILCVLRRRRSAPILH